MKANIVSVSPEKRKLKDLPNGAIIKWVYNDEDKGKEFIVFQGSDFNDSDLDETVPFLLNKKLKLYGANREAFEGGYFEVIGQLELL